MKNKKVNIEELLSQMTLDEKIGQLIQLNANFFADSSADITGPWEKLGIDKEALKTIGSTLNFHGADEMVAIQKKHLEEDRNKIPMLFMMDVIHGYRTIYPIPLALGASFDPEMVKECTEMASKEASSGEQRTRLRRTSLLSARISAALSGETAFAIPSSWLPMALITSAISALSISA